MVCEFTRNEITKKINEKSATPANLAKLFKITLDSLVLNCDGDLIMVNGDDFDAALEDGKVYEVEGDDAIISIVTPGAAAAAVNNQLVQRPSFAVISNEDQISDVVYSVTETTKAMNDNVCMLYDGPNAVLVVNSLAVLAAATDDPSLISEKMPKESFKRLKTPSSFRASLYQVSTSMCGAFRKADTSMGTIRSCLIDMPDHIQDALYSVAAANDKKGLERITNRITKASEKCKVAAETARNSFDEVLKDLQELIHGALAAQSAGETTLKDAVKRLEEFSIRQEQRKNEIKEQEQEHQERIKLVNEAAYAYKEASVPVDVGKLIGLSMIDMGKGLIDKVTSLPGSAFETVKQIGSFGNRDSNHTFNKLEMDIVVLDELDGILTEIQYADTPTMENLTTWIEQLKLIKGSSKIADVMKKTKELQHCLTTMKSNPRQLESKKKMELLVKQLSVLITATKRHFEKNSENETAKEKARLSLAETALKEHTVDNARERLDRETERKDKNMEAMQQSKRDLADLMAKMNNLDLTKVEMESVIKCLEEGCQYLSNVEEHWTKLAQFFDSINLIVKNNLCESIENFNDQIKDGDPVNMLVKPALIASGLCVQVCNCASVYTEVSRKYVMPVISTIAGNLALSKEEAIKKKAQIQIDHEAKNEDVRKLIDSKMDEYSNKFEDQLKKNQEKLCRAITEN
uniref:Uncharacterized protein n=1 Tax=Panagrolaimus davidi TaxID=227884 RepID=A0A914Q6L0_9BILA